jgi:hypothetical protein
MLWLCLDSSISKSFTAYVTLLLSFTEVKSYRLIYHVVLEPKRLSVAMNITVFWDVTLGVVVETYRRFRGTYFT